MAKTQNNLAKFGMIPGAASVAGFIAAAALSVFLVQSQVDSMHQVQLGQAVAFELAQQVNVRLSGIQQLLQKMAESSTAMTAIGGSNADATEAEAALVAMIPGADRVRLIRRGTARPDQGFPPFNYTSVDLVNDLESGSQPAPEVISSELQLRGERWVIFPTAMKSQDGTLQGTLFVHIRADSLGQGLINDQNGEVRIMQTVGTTPRPVTSSGSGGKGAVYTVQLANPNWTLEYSPSTVIGSSAPASLVIYLVPPFVMLLVVLGGILVASNQTGTEIASNLSSLGQQITRIATGTFDDSISYTLAGFADQGNRLKVLLDLKPAPASTPKLEPAEADPKVAAPKSEAEAEAADIQMDDEAEEIGEFEADDFEDVVQEAKKPEHSTVDFDAIEHIFRACDIRGVVGQSLSEDIARQIGLAIGSEAEARGEQQLLVGFDGREYSPALAEALIDGLISSGRDVTNIGSVPTPVLYYGTHNSDTGSGVMVTGSHNAPEYNGFKIVLGGRALAGDEIKALYERIRTNDFTTGEGSVNVDEITQDYMDAIIDDIVVAQPLKVVIDCGNGIAGAVAPELLDSLGCEAVPLYCEVDGSFPNHYPDPTRPENLEDLALTVQSQGADLGIALDGDGNRLVTVTAEGDIVWPDRLLMLFSKDIVSRNPGSDVVYDVKCTRHLNSVISGFGGRPILCRSGHSFIKEKVSETGAMLGGELSGHICFSERWFGFDDGLYSAARLLEIVGSQENGLSDLLQEFPVSVTTPEIHIGIDDSAKFELVDTLTAAADFEDATLTTIDGLRVDFSDGWGLVRASNTEPAITLRFEADNEEALEDIKGAVRELLQEVREDLDFA